MGDYAKQRLAELKPGPITLVPAPPKQLPRINIRISGAFLDMAVQIDSVDDFELLDKLTDAIKRRITKESTL